jgi:hypothetical protein
MGQMVNCQYIASAINAIKPGTVPVDNRKTTANMQYLLQMIDKANNGATSYASKGTKQIVDQAAVTAAIDKYLIKDKLPRPAPIKGDYYPVIVDAVPDTTVYYSAFEGSLLSLFDIDDILARTDTKLYTLAVTTGSAPAKVLLYCHKEHGVVGAIVVGATAQVDAFDKDGGPLSVTAAIAQNVLICKVNNADTTKFKLSSWIDAVQLGIKDQVIYASRVDDPKTIVSEVNTSMFSKKIVGIKHQLMIEQPGVAWTTANLVHDDYGIMCGVSLLKTPALPAARTVSWMRMDSEGVDRQHYLSMSGATFSGASQYGFIDEAKERNYMRLVETASFVALIGGSHYLI